MGAYENALREEGSRADLMRALETAWTELAARDAEIDRLRHDARLGQELETAVCMHTHFTAEPPYVGTEGLVLAIKETAAKAKRSGELIDEVARLRAGPTGGLAP